MSDKSNKDDNDRSDEQTSENFYVPPPRKTIPNERGELYGHDLYPERRKSRKPKTIKNVLLLKEGREESAKFRCETQVYQCITKHPIVKLMMGALKSSGCPIDIRRHFSCEICEDTVTGGYDPELNQVVICQNDTSKATVANVLIHEMIHMFDYCRHELDFKNIDHLACTEVRAANLTYCSFMSALIDGNAALWDVKKRHQECVKKRAMLSVLAARSVSLDEAKAAIDRVFGKCYDDMEPIGRRIRQGDCDMQKALNDAPYYGYNID